MSPELREGIALRPPAVLVERVALLDALLNHRSILVETSDEIDERQGFAEVLVLLVADPNQI